MDKNSPTNTAPAPWAARYRQWTLLGLLAAWSRRDPDDQTRSLPPSTVAEQPLESSAAPSWRFHSDYAANPGLSTADPVLQPSSLPGVPAWTAETAALPLDALLDLYKHRLSWAAVSVTLPRLDRIEDHHPWTALPAPARSHHGAHA